MRTEVHQRAAPRPILRTRLSAACQEVKTLAVKPSRARRQCWVGQLRCDAWRQQICALHPVKSWTAQTNELVDPLGRVRCDAPTTSEAVTPNVPAPPSTREEGGQFKADLPAFLLETLPESFHKPRSGDARNAAQLPAHYFAHDEYSTGWCPCGKASGLRTGWLNP